MVEIFQHARKIWLFPVFFQETFVYILQIWHSERKIFQLLKNLLHFTHEVINFVPLLK
jgi:hypothetical protein